MTVGYTWLEASPSGRSSACDRCGDIVHRTMPRMRVHDKRGPDRKRGKGSKASYVCTQCAYKLFGVRPPISQQERMFE